MLLRKLSCLLVPAILAASMAPNGGAQPAPAVDPRFAFADTTLLRDTLGIHFDRLFELADSLRLTPDTLRALSIRQGFTPQRMVFLADSLHTKVDSVGAWLEREQFNPLARRGKAGGAPTNEFSYNTTYNIQETRSTWGNVSDYTFGWRQLYLRSNANIDMGRFESGGHTTISQTRVSTTEAGLQLSPEYSAGGRAVLRRYNTDDPSAIRSVEERQGDYQVSLRTRQQPRPGISSELNIFSGVTDLTSSRQDKHGLTSEINGRFHHQSGAWFVHELNGQLNGNNVNTLVPQTQVGQKTHDVLGSMNGTLNLFDPAPFGFNGTYSFLRSRVSTPDYNGIFRTVRNLGTDLNGTFRATLGSKGLIHAGETYSRSDQITALNGPTNRHGSTFLADGRYQWLGNVFESTFSTSFTESETPQVDTTGGYGEHVTDRSLTGGITRSFGRINARANARIGLTRYRYATIGAYLTPPVARDLVQQSYRLEGNYAGGGDFSTGVSLEVTRGQFVNLPSASTSQNNTQRIYRGEWRWTYRLFHGLTATQRNTLGATYTAYNFVPENDRALLEFGTATTLNAILTPRLTVDLTHTSRITPSGNYTLQPDGLYYFRTADRSTLYSLESRISYTPISGLSIQLIPSFQSTLRDGASGGTLQPQRLDRSLNFTGNSNLNIHVGRRGVLTGTIGRTFYGSRSSTFSTVPEPSPAFESEFWNGTLNFTWRI